MLSELDKAAGLAASLARRGIRALPAELRIFKGLARIASV